MTRRLTATLVVALAVAACGGDATESTPPAQDSELVAQGEELFQASCAQCHGFDLRGTNTGPPLLSEVYEPGHHGDAAFLVAVQTGSPQHHWDVGPMPPVPGLSAEDVEAIVAFVRDRQRVEGFEPYPP